MPTVAAMISLGVSAGVALPDHTVTSRHNDTQPLSSVAPRTSTGRSLRSKGDLHGHDDDEEGERPQGEVDVEGRAPRDRVCEVAAEQRPDDRACREERACVALVPEALAGREDLADDRLREHVLLATVPGFDVRDVGLDVVSSSGIPMLLTRRS